MNDPRDAWVRYSEAQSKAADEYEDFWIQRFAVEGIKFQKQDYNSISIIGNWEISLSTYPRGYEGVRLTLRNTSQPSLPFDGWRRIKIMSESGIKKFLRLLHTLTSV